MQEMPEKECPVAIAAQKVQEIITWPYKDVHERAEFHFLKPDYRGDARRRSGDTTLEIERRSKLKSEGAIPLSHGPRWKAPVRTEYHHTPQLCDAGRKQSRDITHYVHSLTQPQRWKIKYRFPTHTYLSSK
jgi:hypothetical protein